MKINKNVKTNLLDHSKAKVKLLGEYLKQYLNVISNDNYTESIELYDLFCGPGVYDDKGEGSPIVILKEIKNAFYVANNRKGLKPKYNCHFNDLDTSKIEILKSEIEKKKIQNVKMGTISFKSIDYKDYLTDLEQRLKELKKQKAFIFLDPYEYKHIKLSHIKRLMLNRKSEVLIWLPIQFMYRFESNGTPNALKEFLSEIVPYKDWEKSNSVWEFVNQLKSGFQIKMGDSYFVDNFTIQKDKNTVFCLFFFTPHIKGFEKMLEAKWKIDNENGKGWDYSGNQPSLFNSFKTNPLEVMLLEYLHGGTKTNGEIYEFTLRNGFLPVHSNQIFKNMQTLGKLKVILQNDEIARKGAFYISYKYYKEQATTSKVKFIKT